MTLKVEEPTKKIRTHNSNSVSQEIEKIVKEKEYTYIEAVCAFCQNTGMDYESMPKLLNAQIKEKIEGEALDLNLFKKRKRGKKLPVK